MWVTNRGRIEKLERARAAPVASVAVPAPCGIMAVGFGAVWVVSCRDGALCRVDPVPLRVMASVPTGLADPEGELSVVTGAGSVWVLSDRAGVLSRIDPHTNQVVAQIAVAPYRPIPSSVVAASTFATAGLVGIDHTHPVNATAGMVPGELGTLCAHVQDRRHIPASTRR